ncbi:sulfite exporter TauE/SafE family protein [Paracoccaceae bacterium GXU_MW_L88]
MNSDPMILAATALAVTLVGLSKGGLGGMAIMGVPIMALVMSPVTAAAILLPILLVMDAVSLWTWRGWRDLKTLKLLLPPACFGIFIGWATASFVSDDAIKLIIGIVAAWFVLRQVFQARAGRVEPRAHAAGPAWIWGSVAGYTSFVAHAGSPPFQIYTLPLRLSPQIYTGTSVVFFAVVNTVKLIPYAALGQLDASNLKLSLLFVPLAIASTYAGAWIVKRMRAEVFYPMIYSFVALVAVKLIWDGLGGLLT